MLFNTYRKKVDSYEQGPDGEYKYTGPSYHWDEAAGPERRSSIRLFWIFSAGALVLNVISGSLPAPGMTNTWYVLGCYAIGVLSGVITIFAVKNLAFERDPVRERIYISSISSLAAKSGAAMVFNAASVVAEIVFLIMGWEGGQLHYIILFMILQLAAAFLMLKVRKLYRSITWVKV